jgi:glycosyltransferase involved in cell wall biosynthesis
MVTDNTLPTDRLRILLILENPGAGSGRHVVDLAQGLLQRGHDVTLIYSLSRLEDWFAHAIDAMKGLETHSVPMVRGFSPYDIVSIARIRAIMARSAAPWHIIHGHSSKGGAMARLCGIHSGAAIVYTPHALVTLDPELATLKRVLYTGMERVLAWMSKGIICVSNAEKEHAATLGIPNRKLTVVENCLNPLPPADRIGARELLGLSDDDVCIGFVGRLARQKNLSRLLKAFARVQERAPRAKLAIVGDGPDQAMLQNMAKVLEIDPSVIWTGHADGQALMAGFDIFTLPSDYEAFPYVLLEAAARALPIVSTRVGGAEDVINDNANGFIVDTGEQLGDRLLELVHDVDMRMAMSQASLERSSEFNVDRMVSRTLAYYHELID